MPKKRSKRSRKSFEQYRRKRLADLRHLLRCRCGSVLPDDDAGLEYLEPLLDVMSLAGGCTAETMLSTIGLWAPWMPAHEAVNLVKAVMVKPRDARMPTPKELGRLMRLTNRERERHRLWTIMPCDVTEEQLAEQRRQKDRTRKMKTRRKCGAESREAYLARVTGNQPWLKQKIDRSTYFRRKAKAATRFVRNSENDVRPGSSAAQEAVRLGSSATINTYSAEQPSRTHHKRHRCQRASKGVSDPKATDNPLYQNMTKEDERGRTPRLAAYEFAVRELMATGKETEKMFEAINEAVHRTACDDLSNVREVTSRTSKVATVRDGSGNVDPNGGWEHRTVYAFNDGTVVTLDRKGIHDLAFPATTECDLLWFDIPDAGDPGTHEIKVERARVIGWQSRHDHISPITLGGIEHTDWRRYHAIAFADGHIEWLWHNHDKRHGAESLEEWIAQIRVLWQQRLDLETPKLAQVHFLHCRRKPVLDDEIPF